MSTLIDRELLAQAVVALGTCVGAWFMVVNPQVEKIGELRAEIADVAKQAGDVDEQGVQRLAGHASELLEECVGIQDRSRLARDSAQLFARIMALAREQGVEVRNLQPRVQDSKADSMFGLTRIDIAAEGDYEQIARFIESLDRVGAFLRTTSIRITPVDGAPEPTAALHLSCDALSFTLPGEVARRIRRNES